MISQQIKYIEEENNKLENKSEKNYPGGCM